MKKYILIIVLSIITFINSAQLPQTGGRIQAYQENLSYWQYQNKAILLIGGSSNDNLFQSSNLGEELDVLVSNGGNYVRNSMSSLGDMDKWPYWRSGERFNLDKFNKEYWEALDRFLKLTSERNIVVQLEIWAFDDYTIGWAKNPWNPMNNNVLTEENTMLTSTVLDNIEERKSNFFMSVPKLSNDTLLLEYQKKYVDHLLGITLKYKHIIYSVSDKMLPQYSAEWGWFWANYLKQKADDENLQIEVTESLFQEELLADGNKAIFNHPDYYTFVDISQKAMPLNEDHWDKLMEIKTLISKSERPINYLKIAGGQIGTWTGGPGHGAERFWRSLISGLASARFEEEPIGLGISERAKKHLNSASMLMEEYDFFSSIPDEKFSLILEREQDEAYLARNENQDVVVYFTDGGQIILDFTDFEGTYALKWLNIEGANWYNEANIEGGGILELTSPFAGNWVALLSKE